MKQHWQYLKYVLRHKWYVFLYCLEYGLVWRGIKHDWSKFLPSEWFPYVAYFYGKKVPHPTTQVVSKGEFQPLMLTPDKVQASFDRAWNHHQKANSHHWQYWLLSPDKARPNFWYQSHDGGMTHTTISNDKGQDAAIVYDEQVTWFDPPFELQEQLRRDLYNTPVPLEMPDADRKEMLADWRGAGRALGKPDTWAWYEAEKRDSIFLHPKTREWVEAELLKLKHRHEIKEWRLKTGQF